MFHAITAALACLSARLRDYRAQRDHDIAAVHGWQVYQVAPGTYRYRDRRFNQLVFTGDPKTPAGARWLESR